MKMTSGWIILMALTAIGFGPHTLAWSRAQDPTVSPTPLTRQYREGERLVYRMTASNRDRVRTTVYAATARGVVKRNSAGIFYEEYEWFDISSGMARPSTFLQPIEGFVNCCRWRQITHPRYRTFPGFIPASSGPPRT